MSGERTLIAKVSGPIEGGRGWAFGSPTSIPDGFVLEEFFLDGVAVSYRPVEGTEIGLDGRWSTEEASTAAVSDADVRREAGRARPLQRCRAGELAERHDRPRPRNALAV